ncbi:MAG: efflux RND transporter permease subunit [Holosporales bacterium]|jgi:multidrug efflux pump|nr:efflux RND transporter permease subunit [Holosporales bacterium]
MNLSEICIERPVFAWVMTFVIILLGAVLGYRLQLQQYPKFEHPAVTVEIKMPGAGPEIVEAQITKRLEEAFAGIEGIDHIRSTSNTSQCNIVIVFKQGRDLDEAVNDIRDRLSKERDNIPREANEPRISKSRYDEAAILNISFWSDSMSRSELYDLITKDFQKDFESVPGVGRVDVFGDGLLVMSLYVDPKKMAAYGLSVRNVMDAIRGQNLELPAGHIVSKNREYLVTTVANLERPEQFENMVILTKNGRLVRLRDIGRAEIESAKANTRSYLNGRRGVSVTITKQSNVNPISVARSVKKEIENLKKTRLSDDIHVLVSYDSTEFVEHSLNEVYHTIFESVALVTLVVLLFLNSFRAAIIPLVTIPVSLIGTMIFMYLFKFSLNTFTLLAFVLAVGLVVDDAIVVLENIHRHIEKGISRFRAAILGIKEVSFAVVAMTLTLAAVYTPVALATGMTGKLLSEFAITLACAVILSGFAALTLSPMMCSRMLNRQSLVHGDRSGPLVAMQRTFVRTIQSMVPIEKGMTYLTTSYNSLLRKALDKKSIVILLALVFSGLGGLVYWTLPSQLWPKEDIGMVFIDGHAPQSATIEYTEKYIKELDSILAEIPGIKSREINITNPSFRCIITLDKNQTRSSDSIADEIKNRVRDITGLDFQSIRSGYGGSSDADSIVQFVVRGNKTHKELRDLARSIGIEFRSSGLATQVTTASMNDTEDYTITILRDKVLSLFIDPIVIADTIDALIRGRKVNTFKKDNKLYDVKLEVENESRATPEDILCIHVKGGERQDKLIPLSELIQISPRAAPVEISHYNRTRAVTVTGYMDPRYGIDKGIECVESLKKDILPKDVVLEFTGSTKQFLQESRVMALIFGLAILFIYFVMAAQFESWIDPLIILFSAPLAIISAVLTLAIIKNGSFNLYSNIGLITLIGLITKHGILIVDFANKIQLGECLDKQNAVIKAALIRLRPVVMTTLAMVLGSLPLAFASGSGAETRWQLGWTIVGGMTLGTVFTLFVVPVFYVLMSRVKKPISLSERE